MGYEYPLNDSWSKEEMIDIVQFFTLIEKAYENQVSREDVITLYRRFKEIVPSKSEEKQLFAAFKEASGYQAFPVIKKIKETEQKNIKM